MSSDSQQLIIDTVKEVLAKAGFQANVRAVDGGFGDSAIKVISIESDDNLSVLIGKNGQNLNALEHLVRIIAFKKVSDPTAEFANFVVDINDYRKSRSRYILEMAKNIAQRVISTQKAEALLPMNAYERRLVHTELAGYKEVQTESIGEEPHRRIVIKPLSF